jgi:hypothetical protein
MRRILVMLAALTLSPAAPAQELGRLFFTQEQRAALDARRKARVPDKPTPTVASPTTRVDGYVKRSSGPTTVWVNGEPLGEGAPEAPRVGTGRDAGRVGVTVGEGGGRVDLKPGEVLDRGSGEVRDVIGGGEVRVERKGR